MVLIKFIWIPGLLQNCTSYRHFFLLSEDTTMFCIHGDVEIHFLFLIRF